MAIKRNDEFKRDYEELLKRRETGNEDLVSEQSFEIFKKWGEEVEAIVRADEIYELSETPPHSVRPVSSIESKPIIEFALREGEKVIKREIEGEHLYLKVDVRNYTKEELMRDFEKRIDDYKGILKDKSRARELVVNHWKVWDMAKEGKPLTQITRELHDVQGHPEYEGWSGLYNQIKRAYKRAEAIMEAVKPLP